MKSVLLENVIGKDSSFWNCFKRKVGPAALLFVVLLIRNNLEERNNLETRKK